MRLTALKTPTVELMESQSLKICTLLRRNWPKINPLVQSGALLVRSSRCPTRRFSRSQPAETQDKSERGALSGVKILDLSRVLAAPYCAQILADYGADVIKIEDPKRGDDTRYWRISGEDASWNQGIGPMSNYFAAINRNKRSITLNLKSEKGKEIFMELAKTADVVLENFRPGKTDEMGIGYDTLQKLNPKLIYASLSGYGSSGPFAQRAGYDMIAGAEAGLLHLTGERGGRPVRPGLGLTDMCTGLYIHGAIMGALYAREKTGRGQKVEASLFETQVSLLTNVGLSWLNLGRESERWGTQHPSVVPYDAFKTKDLYFVCGATNDKQFENLCKQLGQEELAQEEKIKTNEKRVENREELFEILNKLFATKTTDEWIKAFEGSGMPYAPINTMEKVFNHPQTKARDMVMEIEFDAAKSGKLSLLGTAVKFSDTKASIRDKPPLLGQHTEEVLAELGVNDKDINGLREAKVIS